MPADLGYSEPTIAALVGHKGRTVTSRYVHSSDAVLLAAADSVARRGRAVAVNLIAATQRPTQKAMGQGAVRSQMDIRVCFRVRERKDVDLILGQGMLAAGWNAHTLNAPGKFLISAPEHDTPRRARAYLVTDEAVTATAARHDIEPLGLLTSYLQACAVDHPEFGGDSILPRCSRLGGRCLPRYRRLTEPRA